MFVLICGYHPFDVYGDLPEPRLLSKIVSCEYDFKDEAWNDVSDTAKNLITALLKIEPTDRMSLATYLESPWIQGVGATKAANPRLASRMSKLLV